MDDCAISKRQEPAYSSKKIKKQLRFQKKRFPYNQTRLWEERAVKSFQDGSKVKILGRAASLVHLVLQNIEGFTKHDNMTFEISKSKERRTTKQQTH